MTREEIIAKWARLSARERDAWIERVLLPISEEEKRERRMFSVGMPHYSTDISAAWRVLDTFPYATVNTSPDFVEAFVWDDDSRRSDAIQPEASEAICLAALIASLQSDGTDATLTEVIANEN